MLEIYNQSFGVSHCLVICMLLQWLIKARGEGYTDNIASARVRTVTIETIIYIY